MDKSLESFILEVYTVLPKAIRKKCFIGGGCLRAFFDGTPIRDIDVFFQCRDDFELAVGLVTGEGWKRLQTGSTSFPSFQHAGLTFNFIGFRYMESHQALALSFDFRCCAMTSCFDEVPLFYFAPSSQEDAREKKLIPLNIQSIDRLSRRVEKYKAYGYRETEELRAAYEVARAIPPDRHNY